MKKTKKYDPSKLTYREEGKANMANVRLIFEDGIDNPIVVIEYPGQAVILDGHHRANLAKENGWLIPGLPISGDRYAKLTSLGYDDMEISYAVLVESGNYEAAESIEAMFPGSPIADRGEEIIEID